MAWGLSGGGYREPAPRRLSLEELLGLSSFRPTPRPAPVTNLRDLEGEDRRRAQQESVFSGLASLGAAMSTGRFDRLGAGVGDVRAAQQGVLTDVNARQDAAWQEENQRGAAEAEDAQRRQKAGSLYGMYEKVVEGEPDGAFTQRAETAARSGSMAELAGMLGEKPKRQAARAKGFDPDAWDVNTRLEEDLKAELKRQGEAAAWEGEKGRLGEKEKIQSDAALAKERTMRSEGLGTYKPPTYETPAHAAAVADAVERVRAKYRPVGGAGETGAYGGKVLKQGDKIVLAKPPDATHKSAYVVPLEGQPEDLGEFESFSSDGKRYIRDKNDPTNAAYEVELREGPMPPRVKPGRSLAGAPPAGARSAEPTVGPAAVQPQRQQGQDVLQTVSAIEQAVGKLSPAMRAQAEADVKANKPIATIIAQIQQALGHRP